MGYIGFAPKVEKTQQPERNDMMPTMDYSKLKGRIRECGFTQKSLAEEIGTSEGQFCLKLTGKYPFKQTEIDRICDALKIEVSEIGVYFFSPES